MDNKNIICHVCNTENEPEYTYCKNCGAALKAEAPKDEQKYGSQNGYRTNFNYSNSSYNNGQPNYNYNGYNTYNNGNNYNNQNVVLETIEGVPTEDMVAFVGKKAYNIMPKFTKMELTGSKTSWCWPAAVLGFIFGPLGAAVWFFFRKMYKQALIFAAAGVIASTAVGLIAGPNVDYDTLQGISGSIASGDYQGAYDAFENATEPQESLRAYIADSVNFAVGISTMVIAGLFGFYFYKKHSANSIKRYCGTSVDPRYYKIGLASIGGTSPGMAILGVIIMIIAQDLINCLVLLV